jgi:uncharacterized protein YndB with AHSA1/START domain
LTDVAEFSRWFSMETAATAFEPGVRVHAVSAYAGPCDQAKFFLDVVEMTAERSFSWRWHPGANPEGEDLSQEPMTLVTFQLEDSEGGTLVTVTESGFDLLFAGRRARVFEENEEGWKIQMAALERYLGETA